MDTREKILLTALELFSREGYEAASVSMIAGELGLTKGALYKHFASKRDIFDSILRRMERRDYENARSFELPAGLFADMPEGFQNTELERLCAYFMAQFIYWTEDEFAADFRRMLSLERYRDPEMEGLYQRYLGSGPLEYARGVLRDSPLGHVGPESPEQLALSFYAPVFFLINIYDSAANKRLVSARLKEHIESFVARWTVRTEKEPEHAGAYPRSRKYCTPELMAMMTGPNPIKLTEELLEENLIKKAGVVCDLGSGNGLTSVFLAREYGFTVYAADLWSDMEDNRRFFDAMGLSPVQIIPVKADAMALPFERDFFDAVVSVDSYNYFGRDEKYLGEKLLPFVKPGGYIYVAVPGMRKDLHGALPRELLLSWTPDQLDFLHDAAYWRALIEQTEGIDIVSLEEMKSKDEVWADWLAQDNSYAKGDRRSMEAGGGEYLNFIRIVIRKR